MSINLGFHNVKSVTIGEDRVFKTDIKFSARTVTLTFEDGTEYHFHIYGDIAGIPVTVHERENERAAA
jgi:hypothetical protein